MLATQNQEDLDSNGGSFVAGVGSVASVHDENKRLVAKMAAMEKDITDLSAINKSLKEEVRHLREILEVVAFFYQSTFSCLSCMI